MITWKMKKMKKKGFHFQIFESNILIQIICVSPNVKEEDKSTLKLIHIDQIDK